MEKQQTKLVQTYSAIGATLGWFAIIAQFYLNIAARTTAIPETIFRFFGYFTVDTNILVALCFTSFFLKANPGWSKFFSRQKVLAAVAVYITVVGVVYNTVLRETWNPEGLQLIVDELLHLIIPILFIVFWSIFVPKKELKWKDALPWLIYPLAYIIYIIILGALTGFYPYPFTDVNKLGYNKALLNGGGLIIVFLLLSLLFVAIGKTLNRPSK